METTIEHPGYYNQGAIETWDVLDSLADGKPVDEAICVWQIGKYLSRYNQKNGLEDIRKAQNYFVRLVKKVEARMERESNDAV